MKRTLIFLILFSIAVPVNVYAQEFSLFGVKMGMTREEMNQVWKKTEAGEYVIENSVVFNIQTEYDHRDRLYILSFSTPIGDQYPSHLMQSALQKLVQELWGKDPAVTVSTRSSRGVLETTVTSRELTEEYINHIKLQLSTLFQP